MAKDLPDLSERCTDISSAYKKDGKTPITDAHDGYGYVAAPVARRIEALLNERLRVAENKIVLLEHAQKETNDTLKKIQFFEHKLNLLISNHEQRPTNEDQRGDST